jgi:uncharacterized protein (DUF1800 family)
MLAACGAVDEPVQRMLSEEPLSRPGLLGSLSEGAPQRRTLAAGTAPTPTAEQFFTFIQTIHAQHFPGGPATQTLLNPPALAGKAGAKRLDYRLYGNGSAVGILDGQVLVISQALTGGALMNAGTLAQFATQIFPRFMPATREQAARFLLQGQFAATDEDIAAVMTLGFAGWLRAQFSMPHDDRAWDWLESRGYGVVDKQAYYDGGHPFFDLAAYRQMLSGTDGVRRRIQLMLTEYFVVSLGSTQPPWPHFAYATFWDGLGDHAFGNFRNLLDFVTLSASMGAFLNTAGNQKEDPTTGRVPDENYAREVMQLFTIGLYKLKPDGTVRRDAAGRQLETYGAADVTELARVFTGYQIDDSGPRITPLVGGGWRPAYPYSRRAMRFMPELHSLQPVRFLGAVIPAGTPGPEALRRALDTLFMHPNVGPFFGRQLIQRLVTSDPSPAYVGRVAAAFNDNGEGVRGDMKAVISAVLLDEEARGNDSLQSATFGRLREPAMRFLQWGRTFRLVSKAGSWKWGIDYANPDLFHGQRLFWAPSVFNFFRPGYVPPGTPMAARGATAPEFQIINESSVAQYVNMLEQHLLEGVWVHAPDRPDYDFATPSPASGYDMPVDYSRETPLAHSTRELVTRLNLLMCAGQLSAGTVDRIVAALDAEPIDIYASQRSRHIRVARALMLVMVCPEYLVQK